MKKEVHLRRVRALLKENQAIRKELKNQIIRESILQALRKINLTKGSLHKRNLQIEIK